MLTRFRALRGGLAARAAVTAAATAATTALAFAVPSPIGATASAAPAHGGGGGGSGSVSQCQNDYVCTVVQDPGSPGSSSGSGGGGGSSGSGGGGATAACSYHGKTYPCEDPGVGVFDSADGCYYQPAQPQPPAGDIAWQGHQPGDGAVYTRTCPDGAGAGQVDVWRPNPPAAPGAVVKVDPAQLARRAVRRNPMPVSQVELAPADRALVGMPIWLWLAKPAGADWPTQAKPLDLQPVSAGGTTVAVQVWVDQVVWDMGDGRTVVCKGPGQPYAPGDTKPDCGYQGYGRPSANQPGGRYPVHATVQWTAKWRVTAGGNGGGQFNLDPVQQRAGSIEIDELQVLNN